MRIFMLNTGYDEDIDVETVLDAGYPFSTLARAQAEAQSQSDHMSEFKTPLEWPTAPATCPPGWRRMAAATTGRSGSANSTPATRTPCRPADCPAAGGSDPR